MILIGTPGQTRIVPVDPNTQRVELIQSTPNGQTHTYNLVTVNSNGVIVSGKMVNYQVAGSGGGTVTGAAQVFIYVSDPNAEGIKPSNLNGAAIAYSTTPGNPQYLWNPATSSWQ